MSAAATGVSPVRLVIQRALGQLALPPPIPVTSLAQSSAAVSSPTLSQTSAGLLPDHLPSRPLPQPLSQALKTKPRIHVPLSKTRPGELYEPTTVFPPEERRVFQDTSYPWCTVGRVDTPGGMCSGVMIGPRHMLTCSHGIQWNSDGTAGWVKFTPAYFDGTFPSFGDSLGAQIYSWVKVDGSDGIDGTEGRSDYVVVVLNSRLGDATGWVGARSYSDSWDGKPFWSHVGYPTDLAVGQRPTFQASISLDGAFFDSNSHKRIFHKGDVWPGQSGGPFFAWWAGESYPSVVAVQSAQNPSENIASGGSNLVTLINKARADFP
jgi:V8-like Glu-specific endopeptidase